MNGDRGVTLLADPDQWLRCAHTATAMLDGGGVELGWSDAESDAQSGSSGPDDQAPGLAFDRWCRAYRSLPAGGRVAVLDSDLTQIVAPPAGSPEPGALRCPSGLAVDPAGRLYVAETGAGAIHVVDLRGQRLLRRLSMRTRSQPRYCPVDVAATCSGAVVLMQHPAAILKVDGRRGPTLGPAVLRPAGAEGLLLTRITAGAPAILLLWTAPTGAEPTSAVVAEPDGTVALIVEDATDLDIEHGGVLVIAREPGQSFRRFRNDGQGWAEIEPLGAPGYDGGAIAVAPNGRVAFTTAQGFGWSSGPSVRYEAAGRVMSYRLDSGTYRTRWGRVFVDACIPAGTSVSLRFLSTDEDDVRDPLPATAPQHGARPVPFPAATPPLPSRLAMGSASLPRPLYRRATGREWAWAQISADDSFETYEAPVDAPPGRYLWVVVELGGTTLNTPRVRALRIERPGHRLLDELPRAWSRDDRAAAFLQRFLAPAEGLLVELDQRAAQRDLLLDPAVTPQEALGWLAGFLGIVLDRRWPEPARRLLVADAFDLFRIRGTRASLERLLGRFLGRDAIVIENWQMRGLGGAILSASPVGKPAPAVAVHGSPSGALGRFTIGGTEPGFDGYTATAHRFTVLIPGNLTPEQRDVVAGLVEQYKPAHTLAEICELGSGMRLGRRLHVGVTSFVGPDAGWTEAVVGQVLVGGDGVIGLPAVGSRLGDQDSSTVGGVRVG